MGMFGNKSTAQEPLHSGEVYHLWSYLHSTKCALVTLQIYRNHSGDQDLINYIDDVIESCFQQEEQQTEAIIKQAGIRLPSAPPDRPNVEVEDIPAGARFHDQEIPLLIQKELMAGRLLCSYVIGISQREDIRSMFSDFYSQKEEYETQILKLSKQKGWLVPPPINVK